MTAAELLVYLVPRRAHVIDTEFDSLH
jgi:hypothetical protein